MVKHYRGQEAKDFIISTNRLSDVINSILNKPEVLIPSIDVFVNEDSMIIMSFYDTSNNDNLTFLLHSYGTSRISNDVGFKMLSVWKANNNKTPYKSIW